MAVKYTSYDDVYKAYAWRDNRRRLVVTQGEGLSSSSTDSNTYIKTAKFQLRDEQGAIELPNSTTAVSLALKKPNGMEVLVSAFYNYTDSATTKSEDRENGIVYFAITQSMTDIAGEVSGEIRLTTSTGVIKFYGINFYVYDGVSSNAAIQSNDFDHLVNALNKVEAVTGGGTIATLDSVIEHGGLHPVVSGVIYDFVDGNYMRCVSIHDAEVDTANDSHTLYIHTTDNYRRGLVIFVDLKVYNGGITVRQYRLLNNGRLEYRLGTVNANTSSNNTYVWDKAYNEDWHPLGTTNNIENLAVTTAKLAEGAVTSAKIGTGEVKSTNIENLAVTENKIADLNITEGKIYNGAVTENKIGTGAVTTDKLGTGAVTSVKLATDSVTTDKVEGLAITTAKIRDSAVTSAKIGTKEVKTGNIDDLAVTAAKLATNSVERDKIKNLAVNEDKLAANAVTTDKIKNSEVTPAKLDRTYTEYTSIYSSELDEATRHGVIYRVIVDGAIATVFCTYNGSGLRTQYAFDVNGRAKYRTQAVAGGEWQTWSDWHPIGTTQNIDDSAVTTAKINDLAVTTGKLKDNAVKTGKINDGAVTQSKLAGNSVGTNELINGSVTTAKINSGAITTGKLDGKAVTTAKLDDDAVTNDKLADDAVDTAQIKNLAVTGAKIANGAVDTAQLAYAAVTNDNIDSNAVGTEEMADGAVTTSKLAASAVTTAKVANGSITPEKLSKAYVDHAPEIFIGTTDKTTTENGTSTKQYSELDRYINKYNGKIWVCTNATQVSDAWVYTWSEKGNFYNYPAQVSYPLNKNAWSNNQIELSGQLWAVADGRKRVDVDIDQATYLQLCADGCAGLFVSTDDSGSTPVFTMNAIGNVPTTDITVQLTLWHVIEL